MNQYEGIAPMLEGIPQTQPASPLTTAAGENDLFSSGFFLRLGFSFMVGLAVGYALKVAFKIALVIGGLLLILLFSLQYSSITDYFCFSSCLGNSKLIAMIQLRVWITLAS